ncbi:Abi-alpha family protein [Edaphobacter aggregans]|uniref:Abi-alpha family protein n=1 Tax=Edaphobacter aggregans TaxID=570835 RepID=UPI001B8080B0|nr:Abi-alpha family protein [Edaphobacter aggregans]
MPPRLFLPILEASSVEGDETLQDLWAGLLATASQQTDSVSPSFIETLKQLTPDEARQLDHVYKTIQKTAPFQRMTNEPVTPYAFTKAGGAPPGSDDTFE